MEEIYITAVPSPGVPVEDQAAEVFSAIRDLLREREARLLAERLFATGGTTAVIEPIRADAYGDLDDGVAPSRLRVERGATGDLAGVQAHAIRGAQAPQVLSLGACGYGRLLDSTHGRYVSLLGLSAAEVGTDPSTQARRMFEKAEAVLAQTGAQMRSVARTWVWLDDILAWYGDFNRVRNRFYYERGLLDNRPEDCHPPASTGIGISPADGARCALDLIAILGEGAEIRHYPAAGRQESPFEYGSAFSRASRAVTPAGETVFVSGTAAVDASGKTQHVGDPTGQIKSTVDNVRAALHDMDCSDHDVVQAIAYSKTIEVERLYAARREDVPWPCLSVLADVCREDLLFEIEVTACRGARNLP